MEEDQKKWTLFSPSVLRPRFRGYRVIDTLGNNQNVVKFESTIFDHGQQDQHSSLESEATPEIRTKVKQSNAADYLKNHRNLFGTKQFQFQQEPAAESSVNSRNPNLLTFSDEFLQTSSKASPTANWNSSAFGLEYKRHLPGVLGHDKDCAVNKVKERTDALWDQIADDCRHQKKSATFALENERQLQQVLEKYKKCAIRRVEELSDSLSDQTESEFSNDSFAALHEKIRAAFAIEKKPEPQQNKASAVKTVEEKSDIASNQTEDEWSLEKFLTRFAVENKCQSQKVDVQSGMKTFKNWKSLSVPDKIKSGSNLKSDRTDFALRNMNQLQGAADRFECYAMNGVGEEPDIVSDQTQEEWNPFKTAENELHRQIVPFGTPSDIYEPDPFSPHRPTLTDAMEFDDLDREQEVCLPLDHRVEPGLLDPPSDCCEPDSLLSGLPSPAEVEFDNLDREFEMIFNRHNKTQVG